MQNVYSSVWDAVSSCVTQEVFAAKQFEVMLNDGNKKTVDGIFFDEAILIHLSIDEINSILGWREIGRSDIFHPFVNNN